MLFQAVAARASYSLSWCNCNYLGDEVGFAIERSDAGAPFLQIATVNSGSAASYIDATANGPIIYTYRVRAFNASGLYSAYTNTVANAPMWLGRAAGGPRRFRREATSFWTAGAFGIPKPRFFSGRSDTNGGLTWTNLTDGGAYSGSATDALTTSPAPPQE